jgi:hypothetical protein
MPNSHANGPACIRTGAFTLVELLVLTGLLALFVALAQMNLFGALQRSRFDGEIQPFVSAMQMAASAAAEGKGRYEVTVDLDDQSYLMRRITGSNLSDVLDEEIIAQGRFGEHCHVSSVQFDDGDYTNSLIAKFRVSQAGWHYGGKIVFLDDGERPHSVTVTRLSPIVDLVEGDPPLLRPKSPDEVPFR